MTTINVPADAVTMRDECGCLDKWVRVPSCADEPEAYEYTRTVVCESHMMQHRRFMKAIIRCEA